MLREFVESIGGYWDTTERRPLGLVSDGKVHVWFLEAVMLELEGDYTPEDLDELSQKLGEPAISGMSIELASTFGSVALGERIAKLMIERWVA
jgi:hypothetical protein